MKQIGDDFMAEKANEGFDKNSFATLYQKENMSFWFRSRNTLIAHLIKKYFCNFTNYLEVGCGTGFVLSTIVHTFPLRQYMGTELFDEGLYYAKQRLPNIPLLKKDVLDFEYNDEFDLIGCFDVLEHIEKDMKAIGKIFHACKAGGGVLITVPQHKCLWSNADQNAHHVRRYSKRELCYKIEQAGFKILYVSGFVSLLFPLMYLQRKMNNNKNATMVQPSRFLNTLFRGIMWIERQLLYIGITFSFGGSLILVGIKDQPAI